MAACLLRDCAQMDDFKRMRKQRIKKYRHLNKTQLNGHKIIIWKTLFILYMQLITFFLLAQLLSHKMYLDASKININSDPFVHRGEDYKNWYRKLFERNNKKVSVYSLFKPHRVRQKFFFFFTPRGNFKFGGGKIQENQWTLLRKL